MKRKIFTFILIIIPNILFANFCVDFENYLINRDNNKDVLYDKQSSNGFGFYLLLDINKDTLSEYINGQDYPYFRDYDNYLIINRITENSPFHKYDIRHNDRLVKINDNNVSEMSDDEFDIFWQDLPNGEIKFQFQLLDADGYIREGFEETDGYVTKKIKRDLIEWPNSIYSVLIPIDLIEVRAEKYEYDLEYQTIITFNDLASHKFVNNYNLEKELACNYTLTPSENPYEKYNLFDPNIREETLIENKSFKQNTVKFSIWPQTEESAVEVIVDIKQRKVSTFSQYFEFYLFPFEKHEILTSFVPMYTNHSLENTINYDQLAVYYSDRLLDTMFTPNFEIITSDYFIYADTDYDNSAIGEEIISSIEIERRSFYFIAKIISPIFLILLLSWSVFFLKPKDVESRLTVSIICFLSLIAYNFVVEDSIPKLSYYTWMDWYVSFSYIFCGLTTFFTIYDYQLVNNNRKLFKITSAMRSSGIFIFIFLNIITFYVLKFHNQGLLNI
tara:strand:- start:982 stop:2487 length:1506 start_codon:yes stop_codon:yes gene_type:complete